MITDILLFAIAVELGILVWRSYATPAVEVAKHVEPLISVADTPSQVEQLVPAIYRRVPMAQIFKCGHLHHICPVGSPDHLEATAEGSGLTVEVS